MSCPFECGFKSPDPYRLSFHLETVHTESGKSGFAVDDDEESLALARQLQNEEDEASNRARLDKASLPLATSSHENDIAHPLGNEAQAGSSFVECPLCSEILYLLDYNDHLDIHASLDETQTITYITGSGSGDEHNSRPSLRMELKSQPSNTVQDTEKCKHENTLSQETTHSLKQDANGLPKPRSLTEDEVHELIVSCSRSKAMHRVSYFTHYFIQRKTMQPLTINSNISYKNLVRSHSKNRCLSGFTNSWSAARLSDISTELAATVDSSERQSWKTKFQASFQC